VSFFNVQTSKGHQSQQCKKKYRDSKMEGVHGHMGSHCTMSVNPYMGAKDSRQLLVNQPHGDSGRFLFFSSFQEEPFGHANLHKNTTTILLTHFCFISEVNEKTTRSSMKHKIKLFFFLEMLV